MNPHSIWAVAAAILYLRANKPMYIEILAEEIWKSGLTTLGSRGITPLRQIVIGQLTGYAHREKFLRSRPACYMLRNPNETCQDWEVMQAIKALEANGAKADLVQTLQQENEELRTMLEDYRSTIEDIQRIALNVAKRK